MDLPRDPNEIARSAAEELRALNHLTGEQLAYRQPVRVHDTAMALRDLAARLPQALQQMQSGLEQLVATGEVRLYDRSGDTLLERQRDVAEAVKAGVVAAAQLEGAMSAVARLTTGMARDEPEEDEEP